VVESHLNPCYDVVTHAHPRGKNRLKDDELLEAALEQFSGIAEEQRENTPDDD